MLFRVSTFIMVSCYTFFGEWSIFILEIAPGDRKSSVPGRDGREMADDEREGHLITSPKRQKMPPLTAVQGNNSIHEYISAKLGFKIQPSNERSDDKDHPIHALPDFLNILLFALQLVPASLHAMGPRTPLAFAS